MGLFNSGRCEICGATDGCREHEALGFTVCRTCAGKYKSITGGNMKDISYFETFVKFPVCTNKAKEAIGKLINPEDKPSENNDLTKSYINYSIADEIEKLWTLKEKGAISMDEYNILKEKIINDK